MNETVREMIQGRMEQAFQKFLWKNEEYSTNQRFVMSREEYHALFEKLKEKLSGSREDEKFLMRFDELIGAYTEKYEEAVYMMGFHDGMEIEPASKLIFHEPFFHPIPSSQFFSQFFILRNRQRDRQETALSAASWSLEAKSRKIPDAISVFPMFKLISFW